MRLVPLLRRWAMALVPAGFRARVRSSDLARRMVTAAVWSTLGTAGVRALSLLAGILLAKIAGKTAFGEFGLLQSTVAMFVAAAGFGLGPTATKHLAELRISDPARAGRILTLSGVSSLVLGITAAVALFLASSWIAKEAMGTPSLAPLLRLGSAMILLNTLLEVQAGALAGFEAFRPSARLALIQGTLTFVGTALGAALAGLDGALCGIIAAASISAGAYFLVLRGLSRQHSIVVPALGWWRERTLLFSFGLPGMLAALLVIPVIWYGQTTLAQQDDGLNQVAEFAVGLRWQALVPLLPGLLCAGYLPVLASLSGASPARRRSLMWKTSRIAVATAILIAVLVIAGSGLILQAYGDSFQSGRPVLCVLTIFGVAQSFNLILLQTLTAMNRVWTRVATNSAWAVVALVLIRVLVPEYGALGLALALSGAQVIHLTLQLPLAVRALGR